jgi:hypothetical protein
MIVRIEVCSDYVVLGDQVKVVLRRPPGVPVYRWVGYWDKCQSWAER